jgi:hypothetical protein
LAWSGLVAATVAAVVFFASLRDGPVNVDSRVALRDTAPTQSFPLTAEPAWEAGAMVAALAAETRTDSWPVERLTMADASAAASWLQAMAPERAAVDRAVAELQTAYLNNPHAVQLAWQLSRICALRADLDIRAARLQEII